MLGVTTAREIALGRRLEGTEIGVTASSRRQIGHKTGEGPMIGHRRSVHIRVNPLISCDLSLGD